MQWNATQDKDRARQDKGKETDRPSVDFKSNQVRVQSSEFKSGEVKSSDQVKSIVLLFLEFD